MDLKLEGDDTERRALRDEENVERISERVGAFTQRRAGLIILTTVIVTFLLFYPLLYMVPTERALDNPGGEVFEIRKEMETKLPPSVHEIPFIIEAKDGDILTQKELWELYQNEEKLRQSETGRDYLYTRYDVESGTMTFGVYTIADAVQTFFYMNPQFGITLENATDDQVKLAVHHILADPISSGLGDWFSEKATHENRTILGQPIVYWESPAMAFIVNANNSMLPQEVTPGLSAGTSGGPEHQRFNRKVQELLRGDEESYELWGIAIDITLEAEEEGMLSFPLILMAGMFILVIVFIHFRSLQVTFLTLIGLGMLIIWLKGFSNLLGLKSSLTLDIIVPIAILVLGVDYVIHSVHRYREEQEKDDDPGNALKNGIAGVGGALFLAMLTTVVAFLSNIYSGTEDIVGFGIAAAVAIVSALIIMGFFIPCLKMKWDSRRLKKRLNQDKIIEKSNGNSEPGKRGKTKGAVLSKIVCSLADKKAILLTVVIIISLMAGYYSTKLEPKLDAKEYFDGNSDFVKSLDKMDEHIGEKGGEPAVVFIKGDLSEPESLVAIQNLIDNMSDDKTVARNPDNGEVNVIAEIFDFLEAVLNSNVTVSKVESLNPGISISDLDENGIPDSKEQLRAVYDHIVQFGISLNETTLRYEPGRIKEYFFHDPQGVEDDVTVVIALIPGTREQSIVKESKKELEEDMEALEGVTGISFYGLTGAGYERDVTLDAVTNSLTDSIIIAVVLCFIILIVAFRSFKYSIVTIIPVMLVAVWLYAFMYIAGFHLNAVTATIAAISIGVGIDYSVHITVRFRQELGKSHDKKKALERAASQSGSALFGSAASTMVGFAIIALAPMPMFSSFGFLTALMILMAFIAALLVLPSMLMSIEK